VSRRLAALLLAGLLGSCLGEADTAASTEAGARLDLASGGSQQGAGAPSRAELPAVLPPEDFLLTQQRLFRVRDAEGRYEVFQEALHADGAGSFQLEVLGHQAPGSQGMNQPSVEWQAAYEFRQRYLVHYRDLHRGDESRVRRNFVWEVLPGSELVAGRAATRHRATNRYGYGSVELVVDDELGLLLGWTVFDETGVVLRSLETTALDLDPDHGGVGWSGPAAPEQPYRGAIDAPTLGFVPLSVRYAPAGYFPVEEKMVLTEQVFGTQVPNLHVEVLSDGLHLLLVAQQGDSGSVGGNQIHRSLLQVVDLGGVRVVQGAVGSHQVYAVGTAPLIELEGTWASAGH
jgi:hypothetical protein